MAGFLRSRLTVRPDPSHVPLPVISHPQSKETNHAKEGSITPLIYRYRTAIVLLSSILLWKYIFANDNRNEESDLQAKTKAPMGDIVYGAKSKGDDTARLVKEAIQSGFRHIATVRDLNVISFVHILTCLPTSIPQPFNQGGFHFEYNETGVGQGWIESGVPRNELYLQTLFVSQSTENYGVLNCLLEAVCPPLSGMSIEEQVKLSVQSSLHNLQTDYIDSVLVHNFRAKLQPYEETLRAWKVLEDYVDKGIIRHLGIVSVHDKEYLTKLHDDARIKPTIIQNRFHSNRSYDINLRPVFKELGFEQNQLFWILTGSAGGKVRNNEVVTKLAIDKGVSNQVLLYSFTMQLGGTPLIGSKSLDHMKEDFDALVKNKLNWKRDELIAMARVLNKNLIQS
jgi:diketogulonate reductase-like aldo/keto reductase